MIEKKESCKGCVLNIWESNGYHDSDFYADVWDEETKTIKSIQYDSTRHGGYGYAIIDATEDVKIKAEKYLARCKYESIIRKENSDIEIGKDVIVTKGRKVKIGTFGKVIGIFENKYSSYNHKVRLLLDNGEKVYTYLDNLKVKPISINKKIEIKIKIMKKHNISTFEI